MGIFLIPSDTTDAFGLSCAPPNIANSIEDTEIIFSGKVISTKVPTFSDERKVEPFTIFKITENFKGNFEGNVTVLSDKTWGPSFQEGLQYLVFADKHDKNIRAQLCAPTDLLENVDVEFVRKLLNEFLSPPLKQMEENILPTNIICKANLELILKSSDDSPACVKPSTAEKLIERGWGKTILQL